MIWVVDASVALRWLLRQEEHPHAQAVLAQMLEHPGRFAVPELFSFEVFAVLSRVHPDAERAFAEGILPVLQGGVVRQPMTTEMVSAAAPLIRLGLTGYDACYGALASLLGGTWLTFDRKAHARLRRRALSHDLWQKMPATWA